MLLNYSIAPLPPPPQPNCFTRIISAEGQKHIVIYAKRCIHPGEELSYDYKFPREEAEAKIPCLCYSKK